MQAIVTKFLPPTNCRGPRVKAKCDAGEVTIHWMHEHDVAENHDNAVWALCQKLQWAERKFRRGSLPRSSRWAYCYVNVSR